MEEPISKGHMNPIDNNPTTRHELMLSTLANSATVINGGLNLNQALQSLLDQTAQALEVDVVSLALIEQTSGELVFRAASGNISQKIVGIRLKPDQDVAGRVLKEGQGVIVQDTSADPRFYSEIDKLTGYNTRTIACAPILWQGQVIGIVQALNPLAGTFVSDTLPLLSTIGGLAGSAIRNAQLNKSLQSALLRYHELFDSNIDAILITDRSGQICEANHQAASLTSLTVDQLIKLKIQQLGIADFDQVGTDFANLKPVDTLSYEATLTSPTESIAQVRVYAHEVKIKGISHFQWILHDITERKNLETLRDDLISMIYHDLRSPLANVVSSLDVLETMLPLEDNQELKSLLNIAIRSTERIQRLTDSLLDMRRIEVGLTVGTLQSIAPHKLVNESIETVQSAAESKQQMIRLQVAPTTPNILVDADMVRRVVINLLENAIKYTPHGSEITIGAQLEQDMVTLWVQDNGPGIPEVARERIFEKFICLNPDNTRGYGLGLAYCKLAVEAHGGQIWVESGDMGGACFKFTLPVEQPK
jgi:NtrC-family two-component system sensor histidine kinase KinB